MSSPGLHYLVYVSSATRLLTADELTELLRKIHANNLRQDITGMLLYKDGNFMQVLEGPEEMVHWTFEKIRRDARHTGVRQLTEGPLEKRNFPDWTMGFRTLDPSALIKIPGYAPLNGETFTSVPFTNHPHRALKLLLTFHKSTGY